MSKELDEYYKMCSYRITEIDDTPLVKVMEGGRFKMLSIEEYEELTNKITDIEAKLAESEEQIWALENQKLHAHNCLNKLKQQLAESEEKIKKAYQEGLLQKQFDKDVEIEQLKQQLAEKDKEIENLEQRVSDKSTALYGAELMARDVQWHLEKQIHELKQANQDKIAFAVEQLEKVKDSVLDVSNGYWKHFMTNGAEYMLSSDLESCLKEYIDDQIKQLKEGK